ncbi:MAG: hypothetical protein HY822_21315 [Acidobacteria bacterium]|nr:hypothetical protein [Acidobacteriota bacterium]
MSKASQPEVSPEQALAGLRAARRLLQSPAAAAAEECVPHLETALGFLAGLEQRLRQNSLAEEERLPLRGKLHRLRRELRRVDSLLEGAADFHARRPAAYGPRGPAEPTPGPIRLRMEG